MKAGAGTRPPASRALIRGVALIAAAVVLGVVLLRAQEPFRPAADPVQTTTTTAEPEKVADPDGDADDEVPEVRDPGDYTVLVANGAGVAGAAGRFSARLADGGFQVAEPTNAERVETSTLYFAEGFEREAGEVAALLDPTPALQPLPEVPPVEDLAGASILLVVGPDLTGPPG